MIESDYLQDSLKFLKKLREIPTLAAFSQDDLKRFLCLSKVRKYQPGEVILAEGFYDCWIYFLISGKVRIVKENQSLSILKHTGEVFGEMSIIDDSPRSATAYALDDTVCLAMDASYIDRLAGHDRVAFCYVLYRVFAEMLAHRLRLANAELVRVKEENRRLHDVHLLAAGSRP